jgi:chromosomal replication initiator protein
VASTLSTGLGEDLHRLEPVLTRTILLHRSERGPVELEHARQALSPGVASARTPSPDLILETVARQFGLRVRDIRGPGRSGPRNTARHLTAYLLKLRCGLSYPEIGRRLGRHHSTIVYAVRQTERRLAHDGSLAHILDLVEKEVALRMERGK